MTFIPVKPNLTTEESLRVFKGGDILVLSRTCKSLHYNSAHTEISPPQLDTTSRKLNYYFLSQIITQLRSGPRLHPRTRARGSSPKRNIHHGQAPYQNKMASDSFDFGGFSSNIISDFGPILSLFGEQVAKQFMSQSMGWADHIIFAMAPLGIITAIVGAIRVGGPSWLRALVGRARESRAIAEVELLSSTSHEVCEMWDGQNLVRIMGSPEIRELIHITPKGGMNGDSEVGKIWMINKHLGIFGAAPRETKI